MIPSAARARASAAAYVAEALPDGPACAVGAPAGSSASDGELAEAHENVGGDGCVGIVGFLDEHAEHWKSIGFDQSLSRTDKEGQEIRTLFATPSISCISIKR